LADLLGQSRSPIKCRLLDQTRVAGLGNIYVDEALFCAGISPTRRASSLGDDEWSSLFHSVREVLGGAIGRRGTTFAAFRDGQGREGENGRHLQVYGRAGRKCPRCAELIERTVLGGRGTHYCPGCQN
jgi:formamidopyrimidine-DNA glycosylase